jgi:hypothetical protein
MFSIANIDHFAYRLWSNEPIAHKLVANVAGHEQQVKRYNAYFSYGGRR